MSMETLATVVCTVALGLLLNWAFRGQLSDLKDALNTRIDDLKSDFRALSSRVEQGIKEHDQLRDQIKDHDDRLTALEESSKPKP